MGGWLLVASNYQPLYYTLCQTLWGCHLSPLCLTRQKYNTQKPLWVLVITTKVYFIKTQLFIRLYGN